MIFEYRLISINWIKLLITNINIHIKYINNFSNFYSLEETIIWILKQNTFKLCLQFPNSLISDSVKVAEFIEFLINVKCFILADKSYSSCCVDEISAQHMKISSIIHYGKACLNSKTYSNVFYVFGKRQIALTSIKYLKKKLGIS